MDQDRALDLELSDPPPDLSGALGRFPGDVVVLGAGGKMGPTLVRLLQRAVDAADDSRRVTAVARFTEAKARAAILDAGARVHPADLLDPAQVAALPDAANVIFMAGQKFGTTGQEARTWAINAFLPGLVAERYRRSRIVAFSTGNVYPLWPAESAGPAEEDPTGPVGEYAQSALARERILTHAAERHGTPLVILRLNYAVEPRYGVLRDVADRVREGRPVDLAMGFVNVIWQRDANAAAIRALGCADTPPVVLNLTGPKVAVRDLAARFGLHWNRAPVFTGQEGTTALLSNPERGQARLGPWLTSVDEMVARIADWIDRGGGSLGKPTRFEERDGRF